MIAILISVSTFRECWCWEIFSVHAKAHVLFSIVRDLILVFTKDVGRRICDAAVLTTNRSDRPMVEPLTFKTSSRTSVCKTNFTTTANNNTTTNNNTLGNNGMGNYEYNNWCVLLLILHSCRTETQVRIFVFTAFIASATVGLLVAGSRFLALTQGIDQGQSFEE